MTTNTTQELLSNNSGAQNKKSEDRNESKGLKFWVWTIIVTLLLPNSISIILVSAEFRSFIHFVVSCLIPFLVLGCFILHYGKDQGKEICKSIIQFQFFGWVVFYVGVVAATNLAISNVSRPQDPESTESALSIYFSSLNLAAPDLVRVSVIAIIILFFTQLVHSFEKNTVIAVEAAAKAREAAAKAGDVGKKLSESVGPAVEEAINILKSGVDCLSIKAITTLIGEILDTIQDNRPSLEVFKELSGSLRSHVERLFHEIRNSSQSSQNDFTEIAAFCALYLSYLKTEQLMFGDRGGGGATEPGGSSCHFATRFSHYGLAVQEIVTTLHKLDGQRYKYYTLFNRRPKQFFNLENHRADPEWSRNFLERFCRWHHSDHVPYQRYFVGCNYRENERQRDVPPAKEMVEHDLDHCHVLCKSNSAVIYEKECNCSNLPIPRNQKFNAPSYIIVDDDEFKLLPDRDKGQYEVLKKVLLTYHNPELKYCTLMFNSLDRYDEFFGYVVPQDLLAVWDTSKDSNNNENGWCLCMGIENWHGDQSPVKLVFATRRRCAGVNWATLTKKLDLLFRPAPNTSNDFFRISKPNFDT